MIYIVYSPLKIIQTSKKRRKLVAYFEALYTLQVFLPTGKAILNLRLKIPRTRRNLVKLDKSWIVINIRRRIRNSSVKMMVS
jgi:hypothetical protein